MKKTKLGVIILGLVGAMAISMVACTGNQSVSESNVSDGAKTSADLGQKVKISMLHFSTEQDAAANVESAMIRKAVSDFKANNPNMELVEEVVAHDVYEAKLKTLAAANELPDIFVALPSFMSQFYENEQILDLKPLMDADPDWSGRFAEGALGDYTFGDKILASSKAAIVNHVLLWNTEIFKKCGIEEFPANADEFKAAVKILRDNGYIPIASGNKGKYLISSQIMPGILSKFTDAAWYENLRNYGGAKFTDPDSLAAITYIDELMKMGLFNEDVNSIEPGQARQLYYSEKAAMYIEGSWVISTFINETTQEILDKTDITIFPVATGKENLQEQIVGGQGWGFCLSSNLKDDGLKLGIDFLKRTTSPESQSMLVEKGALAVIKNVSVDEDKLHPFYKEFLTMYNSHSTIMGCPEVQLSATYMDASYTGYQELSIGSLTPQQLAEKLQAAHEEAKD